MKKGCELCTKPARMYCDSDQARLCWECDERVHCANFLVAKHFRSLLCHVCQSPTPWKASGAKLGPTVSVCDGCSTNSFNNNKGAAAAAQSSRRHHHREDEETTESFVGEDSDDSEDDDDDYSSEEDEADGEDEEEDGENQVVPWSPSDIPSASAPPLTTSYCSEQESLSTREGGEAVSSSSALKRFRHNSRLESDDEDVCCSSQINSKIAASEEDNGGSSYRAIELKMSRREECSSRATTGETESRRKFRKIEIMRSLLTFQQRMACSDHNASAAEIIRGISKLSGDI